MKLPLHPQNWKPSKVSWLSFLLLSLVVAAAGISANRLIFDYLYLQLMEHGIQHNREIARNLAPRLEKAISERSSDAIEVLNHAIEDYKAFGFRIFIIDQSEKSLIVDSELRLIAPLKIDQSWLETVVKMDGSPASLDDQNGEFLTRKDPSQAMLIWLQPMTIHGNRQLALGIAKNQRDLIELTEDLHFYVDETLLVTFILITLLGFFAMRSAGRFYERSLEDRIRQRTAELSEAHQDALSKTRLATIGKTAAVLTHEMRNPMASIKLALSALNNSENLNQREQKRVSMVLSEIDRLDQLLSDTLDYVRPVKLSEQALDLDELLDQVLQTQHDALQQKSIRLTQQRCPECSRLPMDRQQMHQALLNLVKNAIEASPKRGHIELGLQQHQEEIILQLCNDGGPLDQQTLQQAFTPFYSTKPKGTGLGLGLVKRVVEEHGGSVAIHNAKNNQVCVRLQFNPKHQPASAEDQFDAKGKSL